jgi:hypothetical protein
MTEMSPLSSILMRLLRAGIWGTMAFLLFFAGLLLFQRWTPEGLVLQRTDYGFLTVLGALFLLAIYLVRGIRKELDRPGR